MTNKLKEITIRKAKRITTKAQDGSYKMDETEVSETWAGDELDEQGLINRVDDLVSKNLGTRELPDPTDEWPEPTRPSSGPSRSTIINTKPKEENANIK